MFDIFLGFCLILAVIILICALVDCLLILEKEILKKRCGYLLKNKGINEEYGKYGTYPDIEVGMEMKEY